MNVKAESGKSSATNTLLLAVSVLLLIGGAVGYYYFQDAVITPIRVVALMLVAGIAAFIAGKSDAGAGFFRFLKEADIERRKVVWPTHQETLQTSLMVLVVVLLISLFLAGVDWLLGAGVRALIGGGS